MCAKREPVNESCWNDGQLVSWSSSKTQDWSVFSEATARQNAKGTKGIDGPERKYQKNTQNLCKFINLQIYLKCASLENWPLCLIFTTEKCHIIKSPAYLKRTNIFFHVLSLLSFSSSLLLSFYLPNLPFPFIHISKAE